MAPWKRMRVTAHGASAALSTPLEQLAQVPEWQDLKVLIRILKFEPESSSVLPPERGCVHRLLINKANPGKGVVS